MSTNMSSPTWGAAEGSGNGEKVGLRVYCTPSTVSSTTTSVKVTAEIWVWTQYSYNDSQTAEILGGWSSTSWSGTVSTSSNSGGWSTSNKKLIKTVTKTVTPSTAEAKTGYITVNMSGLYSGGTPSHKVNYSVDKKPSAAAGVPSIDYTGYNFGSTVNSLSFSTKTPSSTNTITSASIVVTIGTTTISAATIGVKTLSKTVSTTASTFYVPLTAANIKAILTAWRGSLSTSPSFSITFSFSGGTSIETFTLPDLSDLFILSAIAERGGSGQSIVYKVEGSSNNPFTQASAITGAYPDTSIFNLFKLEGQSYLPGSTLGVQGFTTDNLTASAPNSTFVALPAKSETPIATNQQSLQYNMWLKLQSDNTVYGFGSYSEPPLRDNLLSMRIVTPTEQRVGINTSNPGTTLDVNGIITGKGLTINGASSFSTPPTGLFADSGILTSGYTAGANWTIDEVEYRKVGKVVTLRCVFMRKAGSGDVPATTSGNLDNETILTMPLGYRPAINTAMSSVASGYLTGGYISTAGNLVLTAVTSGYGANEGYALSLGGTYVTP